MWQELVNDFGRAQRSLTDLKSHWQISLVTVFISSSKPPRRSAHQHMQGMHRLHAVEWSGEVRKGASNEGDQGVNIF
jgi:hypothetical protein